MVCAKLALCRHVRLKLTLSSTISGRKFVSERMFKKLFDVKGLSWSPGFRSFSSTGWSGDTLSLRKYCLGNLFVDKIHQTVDLWDAPREWNTLLQPFYITSSITFLVVNLFFNFPIGPTKFVPLSEQTPFTLPLRLRNLIKNKIKSSVSKDVATFKNPCQWKWQPI